MNIKSVQVVDYKEAGINYGLVEELYDNGTGKDVERFLELGFIRFMFENGECLDELDHLKELDDEVLIEF